MDPMAEIRETFFIECEELLEAMEADLLLMSEGNADSETVNAVFRAVHSIKGGAGAFALDELVRFAHKFETTLDEVRNGRLDPDTEVMKVFLRAADLLNDLVKAARDDLETDKAQVDAQLAELAALTGDDSADTGGTSTDAASGSDEEDAFDFQPLALSMDLDLPGDDDADSSAFIIKFRPHAALFENGNEASLLLRALEALGDVDVECDLTDLPDFDALDAHGAYLSWTITLTTDEGADEISDVFDFVEGQCDLTISEGGADETSAEPLHETGTDESEEPADAVEAAQAPAAAEPEPQPVVAEKPAEEKEEPKQAARKAAPAAPKATVRVDLERVDRLINLVGELVINQAMLSECISDEGLTQSSGIVSGLDEFKRLTRNIQESVMAIRAQPVKPLFQRMSRIVREASDATGKQVRLVLEGETTEVDKTVVERLADPLTHMIRNAVDHGLESPEARTEAGKSVGGTVTLSAAHRSGRVVIEVADDGAGINRERVKAKAIEKGLIQPDAELTPTETDNLLFMPGFSTAAEVSDLSGRGVGMDVVKRSIQALGGRITIASEPGRGSVFTISLPLTLAVLDGMVVRVADQTLVVPLTAILETMRPAESDIHEMGAGSHVVFIRGQFLPIIDVGYKLGYRPTPADFDDCVIILIEGDDGTLSALVVDAIQDQRQVVIKGLEENYGSVDGIAAATILGDGRIALIIDADALITEHSINQSALANAAA